MDLELKCVVDYDIKETTVKVNGVTFIYHDV